MKARPGLRSGIDCSSSLSLVIPAPRFVIPAIESMPRTPIRGRNPEGWREGNVARGLVPRLGRAASSPALHHPALSHFHPLVRPSQDHGDSRHPTRHCYENRPLRQPLIRHSRHPFANPVPHSSFRRRPESRGVGRGECSTGACLQLRAGRSFAQGGPPGVPPFSSSYAAFARPW